MWDIIPRPPYQPKFGPIEYAICQVVAELQQDANTDWTTAMLPQQIVNAANRIGRRGGFDRTFEHCGYKP